MTQNDNATTLWERAWSCYRDGKHQAALRSCREIIELHPQHADTWHLQGLLEHHFGRTESAIASIQQALLHDFDRAEFRNTLGVIYLSKGQLTDAEQEFRNAIRLNTNYPECCRNLVECLLLQQREREAEYLTKLHAQNFPQDVATQKQLVSCLLRKNRIQEAVDVLHHILSLQPHDVESLLQLGELAHQNGQPDQAISLLRRCLAIEPTHSKALLSLGTLLARTSHRGMQLPLPEIRLRQSEAVALLRRLIAIDESPEALYWLGIVLERQDNHSEASYFLEEAVARDDTATEALIDLGVIRVNLGQQTNAAQQFVKAIKRGVSVPRAWFHYSMTNQSSHPHNDIDGLLAMLADPLVTNRDRVFLHFATAKLLDRVAEYERAFQHYALANELKLKQQTAPKTRADTEFEKQLLNLDAQFFKDRHSWGCKSTRPIFVVGVPRSGTTLTEQILATHSMVFGAGELQDIPWLSHSLTQHCAGVYPASLAQLDEMTIRKAAEGHGRFLSHLSCGAERVVDKMPGNTKHIGLIALMFPNAKVICCHRDPLDTCVSGFRSFLDWPHCNLEAAGHSFRHIERVVQHWDSVLPTKIHHLHYEKLVHDTEHQIRKLIEYCELPWESDCLEFFKTTRSVGTPSKLQVRQPIYDKSIGSWKRYAPCIQSLFESLGLATDDKPNI